ncbi:hypothetical protein EOPP23_20020 [Endozoicomonas sp. OPT23]|uniref:BatD family protein n=1 Tax=Endozoicomonas sp. OPT23 TaxID=2072845 RepID=UPI00129BAB78|nr:BatD family protein [Endozoicomonas sp. OPT23]MRI35260.1 hypothetical protein [Endozoicomonas sp. OPT23]
MVRPANQSFKQLLLLISLAVLSLQALASFTASVDRNSIAQYETFELTLRTDEDTSEAPDLDTLERDFDILGTRQNRQVRIINGKSESWRDWVVTLSPKRTGRLVIPEIPLDNLRSQAIAVQVSAGSGNTDATDNASPVFIRSSVNSETVYVQQEIVLTLQIFHRVELFDDRRLTPLNIDDALIQQLGETRSYDTVSNGVRFGVMELKFSIHPQQSGLLEIPSLTFSGTMADRRSSFGSFFSMGSGKPVIARSPEIVISVQPQPDSYKGNLWLPAKNLTLTDGWSSSLDEIKVGDAVTRTIVIAADGLSSAQLPSINMPKPQGINTYPDQTAADDKASDTGVVGSRIEATALIPTRPGTVTLPPVKITWFDTQTNSAQVAEIPARTFTVKPSTNVEPIVSSVPEVSKTVDSGEENCPAVMPPEETLNSSDTLLWQIVAGILALLWLLTTALFLRQKSHKDKADKPQSEVKNTEESENTAFSAFEKACKANDFTAARQAFIRWYQLATDSKSPVTLSQICIELNNQELLKIVNQLESGQYSNDRLHHNNCRPWLDLVKKIKKSNLSGNHETSNLPPLYPQN